MNGAFNRDYDDILRRALHAAAESVEPSGDGLERIRERLGRPPLLSFSSISGWGSVAAVRLTGWAVPAFGTACEIFWALVDRFKPTDTPPGHAARPGLRWLRPVTATGLAIFVVAAGAFAAMAIPRIITTAPTASSGQTGQNGGAGGGGGQGVVNGSSPIHTPTDSTGFSRPTSTSPAASKCHATSSPSTGVTPSPGSSNSSAPGSTSATPTPTTTSPSPSTTTSPSPTTSDTTPTQPTSGTTGTAGSAAASSSPASSGSGSASGGSPDPTATGLAPTGNQAAGRDKTAAPVGSSFSGFPCVTASPSSSPSRTVTTHTFGLRQSVLTVTSSGRTAWFVLPTGRSGESF